MTLSVSINLPLLFSSGLNLVFDDLKFYRLGEFTEDPSLLDDWSYSLFLLFPKELSLSFDGDPELDLFNYSFPFILELDKWDALFKLFFEDCF